ncbi:hypothetical protein G7Y89_g13295 [Cudoniella acicularis]|uniref:Peptidase A1 domain-containing protein n=1 Tax=Cudoniella acicularis TaxID=354080 RepID=A0A8H4R7K1_9HELO|nr:hypothetical protein G7Y89_g13295 [Cudoniella acicularis]
MFAMSRVLLAAMAFVALSFSAVVRDQQDQTGHHELLPSTSSPVSNSPGVLQMELSPHADAALLKKRKSSNPLLNVISGYTIAIRTGNTTGEFYTDDLAIGGAIITGQQFAVANESYLNDFGVMGIGWGYGVDTSYYNVIDQLYVQGITYSRAFSLDLASVDVAKGLNSPVVTVSSLSSSGSIIFGGIDTMRYIGSLRKIPMILYYLSPDGYPRYWIYLDAITINLPNSTLPTPISTSTTTTTPSRFTSLFGIVKGRTEADLLSLSKDPSFKNLRPFSVRPGGVDASEHKEIHGFYKERTGLMKVVEATVMPLLRRVGRGMVSPTRELGAFLTGLAMGDGKPLEGRGVEGEGRTVANVGFRRLAGVP